MSSPALDSYGGFFTHGVAATGRSRCRSCSCRSGCSRSARSRAAASRDGLLIAACAAPVVAVPVLHALLCARSCCCCTRWAAAPSAGVEGVRLGPAARRAGLRADDRRADRMMGRESTDGVREWWSRLGAGSAIYATAWMVITVSAVYGPQWVALGTRPRHPWTTLIGWRRLDRHGRSAACSPAIRRPPAARRAKSLGAKAKECSPRSRRSSSSPVCCSAVAYVLDRASDQRRTDWTSDWRDARTRDHASFATCRWSLLAACLVALLVLMAARVDINEFSLNAFYRNRLVRCYLGATRFDRGERNPQNFTGSTTTTTSRWPIWPIRRARPARCTSSTARSTSAARAISRCTRATAPRSRLTPAVLRQRAISRATQTGKADGAGLRAHRRQYGGRIGAPTLGQAISVSGAAASPNMGYHTSPVVAFLLTLFNVRLGWWFPNPAQDRRPTRRRRTST